MKLRLKLSIAAVRKYRAKAANWTDAAAYQAEMAARAAGLVAWQGSGKAESFIGGRWVVVGRFEPFVGPQIRNAPQAPDVFVMDAGCARCGEPLDDAATRGLCSPCEREVARKHAAMIEEAAMAEAA